MPRSKSVLTLLFAASAALLTTSAAARAQEVDVEVAPPTPPAPPAPPLPPAPPALPPNIHVAPDGSVDVHRTPDQGVDVHAQTEAGTVHAYSCSRVQLDPKTANGGTAVVQPCPQAAPSPYPYGYYPYPPPAYYALPAYYYPAPVYAPPPRRSRYAPDAARTGALIASSLAFGLGTAAAGGAYAASTMAPACSDLYTYGSDYDSCQAHPSKAALWTMGAFMTVTPSIPRYVMGDVGMGVLFTALRGGSFAVGALPDWKDSTYVLPVTFAFIIPVTLGIVDLATTPHREQMEKREREAAARDANKVKLKSFGPTFAKDDRGDTIKSLAAGGTF